MAGNVKGITIKLQGDTTDFDRAISNATKETAKIDTELKKVDKALKFNPTSVELWRQKQTLLTQKISETETKLKSLKDKQADMKAKGVDENSKEYRELQREIVATESRLKTFKGQLKSIGSANLKALGEQFKQVGKKMTAVGKSLSMYVTAPLVAAGTASVKAGMDFDTAIAQVAATSGKTVDEIKDLRDFAQEMGATTAFSATQAAEGLNYMALAGYDAETSIKMLPTVLNLAAAGAMELGAASDMVTDAQTALGLSTEETEVMVDQMAAASARSNTSVSQLGDAILKIGPNAKSLSGGTQELSTVLGLLADNGIKGSEAGTHLRNILLSLNPTTDAAANAWEDLGVSAYDAEGNVRPMEEIFLDLQEAMDGLTTEERTRLLSKMFNKTDLAAVNSLLSTSADRWEELGVAIGDSGGAADKMADTQLDNLQGAITLLKSALEGAAISISDVLTPYLRMAAEFVNGLVTAFNELDPSIQKVIVAIGVVAAAIGPLLVIGGAIATAIGTILPMLAGVTAPMVAIGAAIAAFVAILTVALAKSEPFRSAIAGLVSSIAKSLMPIFKELIKTVKSLFHIIGELITEVANLLAPAIKALTPIITAIIKMLFTGLRAKLLLIITIIKTVVTVIKAFAKVVKTVFTAVATRASALYTKIKTVFGKFKDAMRNPVKAAKDAILNALSSIRDRISPIYDKVKSVFSGIKDTMTGPFNRAKDIIKGIIDKIKGFFNIKDIKAPKIPLPHFKIKPEGWKIGDLVKGKIPNLAVDWYAQGGIFNAPTIAGIGEAGPEAVIPLDTLWKKLDLIAASNGGNTFNIYGGSGMDAKAIAREVENVLVQQQKQRLKAWGY